ncbi:GTPase [Pseudomonas koreensis]|uniref:50S ribosome-binding GTPase n=1 Tax=Pseudomonas koreensis TaxID=198620 RepID=A0A9X2XEZ1_9PSED|nr:GTPase [Pseudomonas koreensis]MCU7247257.1 50S ribosome-binding GTPase [Pseudomonas koreensis]
MNQPNEALDDALSKATADAVARSQEEVSKLSRRVASVLAQLGKTADFALSQRLPDAEGDVAQTLADILNDKRRLILDLVNRQKNALSTFNIVLFGRTGAGKSSLITAFTRGNGSIVSQGESDWTTDVQPLAWNACLIYDTPGINGWGRNNSRKDLEARARKAVEVADFVLVCFDSQSQQADEFAKFAAWVSEYRKPVIAVLNPRNAMWRMPGRVSAPMARGNLSRAVSEHATNIRDELSRLGVNDVPVVAVSSKRAVFARASMPFEGPDLESLTKQRNLYSCDSLEQWSNYPRLEDLLVSVITDAAVDIRLGSLNDQLRGVFSSLRRAIDEIRHESILGAESLERNILEPMLALVGYPALDDSDRRKTLAVDDVDLLTELEQIRGGRFQAPQEGEYAQQISLMLGTTLGNLCHASLSKADRIVRVAFERRKKLSSEDVRAECFDEKEIIEQAQSVLVRGLRFLQAKARLTLSDAKLEMDIRLQGCTIDGDAGSGWKYSAWAIKGGGVLAGVIGALGSFAAINAWNPFGWAAGAAAAIGLAGAVAASFFGWGGQKARDQAEREHLEGRRRATAELHQLIYKAYSGVREEVLAQSEFVLLSATRDLLFPAVRNALSLRLVAQKCATVIETINEQSESLDVSRNAQLLVWEIAQNREREMFSQRPNAGALYWLGEDWIEDPHGLTLTQGGSIAGRARTYELNVFEKLFLGMRGFLSRFTRDLTLPDSLAWLNDVQQACARYPGDEDVLKTLVDYSRSGRPRIHVIGDYNTGKSSFIKRLLLDAGLPVPDTLKVAGKPLTDVSHTYDIDGVDLIDSPGFQSSHHVHTQEAWAALADASIVIFLLQPNLIVGDDSPLRTVISGDYGKGIVDKRDSTYFIVNRSDELGVDPELSPDVYLKLVERKGVELRQALASRSVNVDERQIFFMSSDPYGLVGDRSDADASAFDPYRNWDGFTPFMMELRALRQGLSVSGIAHSILHGGIHRLWQQILVLRSELEQMRRQTTELEQLKLLILECIDQGDRLGENYRFRLRSLVHNKANALKQSMLSERDPVKLKAKAEHLHNWWNDPELEADIIDWQTMFSKDLERWQHLSNERISRRIESVTFRHAFKREQPRGEKVNDAKGKGWAFEIFDKVGRSFGGATRDVVYSIGKSLGFKFRPWGAVKLAKTFAKAGAVIAVIGVVVDFAFIFVDEKRVAEREAARKALADSLDKSSDQLIEILTEGTDDAPGFIRGKDELVGRFRECDEALGRDILILSQQYETTSERVDVYRSLCSRGLILLGKNGDELE